MKLYEHTYYVAEKRVDGRWKRQAIEDETAEQVAARISRVVGSAESEWRVVGVTETESVVLNLPNKRGSH